MARNPSQQCFITDSGAKLLNAFPITWGCVWQRNYMSLGHWLQRDLRPTFHSAWFSCQALDLHKGTFLHVEANKKRPRVSSHGDRDARLVHRLHDALNNISHLWLGLAEEACFGRETEIRHVGFSCLRSTKS